MTLRQQAIRPDDLGFDGEPSTVASGETGNFRRSSRWAATDGILWLLANGVPQDRIVWVRPRDPWMRVVVQPDPVVAVGLAVDTMTAAAAAESLGDLLRLEAAGVMLRIDRDVIPTMAKTPPLEWGSSTCSASSRTSSARDTSST